MPLKMCNKCQCKKPISEFGKDRARYDGLTYRCLECRKTANKIQSDVIRAQKRNHYERNKEILLARKRESYLGNAEKKRTYQRAYAAARPEETKLKSKLFYAKNPDYYKQFRQKYPDRINAKEVKRKTAKMNRTPPWLTEDDFWLIEQAYDLAAKRTQMFGFSWHVDHIIPLQGKIVSGLHVPCNLQVIPGSINTSKQNKFEVQDGA
jgi:hypothetical protein